MTALTIGSLFSGYGGLDRGVADALDAPTRLAWVCEIDPAPARILAHHYPDVPNLGDITRVRWADVERVDVLTGGFPCQDVSLAGGRAGLREGTRSGLWSHMAAAIDALRPRLVVIENVRGLLSAAAHSDVEPCPWCMGDDPGEPPLRALGAVLADLAELGYDAAWHGLRAADVGAPHGRYRVFITAWPAPQDADGAARRQRGVAAPGPAEGGWARADARGRGRAPAPDAERDGLAGRSHPDRRDGAAHGDPARGSDADVPIGSDPRRLPIVPVAGPVPRDRPGGTAPGVHDLGPAPAVVAWGPYAAAVERWEHVLGRVAPAPTERAPKGGQRLAPPFVEWMMGLPAGWVTDVPGLTRNEQLKALGNGVVPQQAAHAVRVLLEVS